MNIYLGIDMLDAGLHCIGRQDKNPATVDTALKELLA